MASDYVILGGFVLAWVVISRICFTVFSCPDHLKPKNNGGKKTKSYYDYYGNYVSIAHAVSAVILGFYAYHVEGVTFGTDNFGISKLVVYNSFAYFFYDTVISEYYGYNTLPMTLHHATVLIGTGMIIFYYKQCASEVSYSLAIIEISNPFNLGREILRHKKQENTKMYLNTSLIFTILFIVTRFLVFPFHLFKIYSFTSNLFIELLVAFIWFISWHWLFVIFNFALKEIKVFSERSAKKDSAKANVIASSYSKLVGLRKNKLFLAGFYLSATALSFGTLALLHNSPKK
jgi:hypothetical protein